MCIWERRNICSGLVAEPEGGRVLGGPEHRWYDYMVIGVTAVS
jgi:hypothetical protein